MKEQFENDLKLQNLGGVQGYTGLVVICIREKDNGSHKLRLDILEEFEEHVDGFEMQLGLIASVGLGAHFGRADLAEDEDEE